MKNILVLDSNTNFLNELNGRLLLDLPDDMDVYLSNDYDDVDTQLEENDIAMVVFNMADYDYFLDMDFMDRVETVSYAMNSEALMNSQRRKIPSFGIIRNSKGLLQQLTDNNITYFDEEEEEPPRRMPHLNIKEKEPKKPTEPEESFEEEEVKEPESFEDEFGEDIFDDFEAEENEADDMVPAAPPSKKKQENRILKAEKKPKSRAPEEEKKPESRKPVRAENPKSRQESVRTRRENQSEEMEDNRSNSRPARRHEATQPVSQETQEEQPVRRRRRRSQRERMQAIQEADRREANRLQKKLKEEVDRDMNLSKAPAKIITVYSAKGGVGKTTIASELATVLSLTASGRDHLNVCIVDYNIDFGDVLFTLGFNPKKTCMSYWASDIQELLNAGTEPIYTQEEIRSQYLQKNPDSGLYALIAPLTNEDSMLLKEEQLRIMLQNLRDYGGFDYIICDTGNNTRDSSYIALEMADQVLLVLTQSVNTVNCNDSFLSTISKIHFDMGKFAVVVNQVRPDKAVVITLDEVENYLKNPLTDKPYPCFGSIKDNNDVMKANNNGEPLAYNSNHEFTKSIRQIASRIMGDTFVLEKPNAKKKKKGLFSFFSK